MFRDCLHYRSLIRNLVLKDIKLKYRGSVLGVVWSLLRPLLLILVYTVAFKYVVRIRMENYAFFLLAGLLPWNFFSGAAMASTEAVRENANLIKKIYFPREVLPIATVIFNFAQFLLALAVFLPLFFLLGAPSLGTVQILFFLVLALHFLFSVGTALILSALTSSYRDVAHLTEVGLSLLFWVTPIIYPLSMVPPRYQGMMKANPLAAFTVTYQDLLCWSKIPAPEILLSLFLWTFGIFLGGYLLFKRYEPSLAELV